VIASFVFSAKGAAFILAWGSALGIVVQRRDPSAEGAHSSPVRVSPRRAGM